MSGQWPQARYREAAAGLLTAFDVAIRIPWLTSLRKAAGTSGEQKPQAEESASFKKYADVGRKEIWTRFEGRVR